MKNFFRTLTGSKNIRFDSRGNLLRRLQKLTLRRIYAAARRHTPALDKPMLLSIHRAQPTKIAATALNVPNTIENVPFVCPSVEYTETNRTGLGNSAERSLDDILSEYRARATNIARWEAALKAAQDSGDQVMADHFQSLITREESTLATVGAAAQAAGATKADLDTIRGEANAAATDPDVSIDLQPWNGGESLYASAISAFFPAVGTTFGNGEAVSFLVAV